MLENLSEWLDRDEYESDLKQLLLDLSIDMFELKLGLLLKLTRVTDLDMLNMANACGHLISLLSIKYKFATPRVLIQNHIDSSMSNYLRKCDDLSGPICV